ncbi:hypothetical protein E2542_SST15290 [Spatholobus suberectus]|nr:hypothetical protein E2542_SST15290 [Spatholobus suberectus]
MRPRIGCTVVCLALVLAVFVIARDLKAFAFLAANEKEDSESFAGTPSRSWDQGTKTCIRTEGLLKGYSVVILAGQLLTDVLFCLFLH